MNIHNPERASRVYFEPFPLEARSGSESQALKNLIPLKWWQPRDRGNWRMKNGLNFKTRPSDPQTATTQRFSFSLATIRVCKQKVMKIRMLALMVAN